MLLAEQANASTPEDLSSAAQHPLSPSRARDAQRAWARQPLSARLSIVRRVREKLAAEAADLPALLDPALPRTPADTLAAEVLPFLAACRFLEQEAASVLAPRLAGRRGRPVWLSGTQATVERQPYGTILVIAPANYPLLLPGVQAVQALVAGNAVRWKPAAGGSALAHFMQQTFSRAGLPEGLLEILDDTPEAAQGALREGVDKVVLTGSAETGRSVLRAAAETLTPVTAELSGNDAVILLPSADISAAVEALAFGLRLNGSATCMAPRRIFLVGFTRKRRKEFLLKLRSAVSALAPVVLGAQRRSILRRLVQDALRQGAVPLLDRDLEEGDAVHATVLLRITPRMQVAQADLFAPVLLILEAANEQEVLRAQDACPYALTAAIFGRLRDAKRLARSLEVGTVLMNDVIVSTADPRLPFGGRRQSGFGSTRGAEGLLEMTVPRVLVTRSGRGRRRFAPTGAAHLGLFAGLAAMLYAGSLLERRAGMATMLEAARSVGSRKQE